MLNGTENSDRTDVYRTAVIDVFVRKREKKKKPSTEQLKEQYDTV